VGFAFANKCLDDLPFFWRNLRSFCNEADVRASEAFIKEKSTETIESHICLAPHAHKYWDNQNFALEPLDISDDRKTLRLRFHWLCPGNLASLSLTGADFKDEVGFLVEPPSLKPANLRQGGYRSPGAEGPPPNLRLHNCETDQVIPSGQVVTMTTPDPETLPLPNLDILRMQWFLHRVCALAGAAGYRDEDDDEDDDMEVAESVAVSDEDDFATELDSKLRGHLWLEAAKSRLGDNWVPRQDLLVE
jgi:hypothetical protein